MAKPQSVFNYTMEAAGDTVALDVSLLYDEYNLIPETSPTVLVGNLTISPSGTPKAGMKFVINYGGLMSYDGGIISIFSRVLTALEALKLYTITCTYINAAWVVKLEFSDLSTIEGTYVTDGTIVGSTKLVAGSVSLSKLVVGAVRGYFLRAGVGGVWEATNGVTSGNILQGNGTDIVSNAVTGDITINGSGITIIGAGKVTQAMLAYTPMEYLEVNRTFSSAEVLTLYSSNTNTGIELLAAPGVGKYIELI